ncbi:MAG TPA: SCO family protein [Polyangiaceae bacterium]|jgi:protein SCO1/2|nr:SCO family protein [Polyangiaceae bacterium]
MPFSKPAAPRFLRRPLRALAVAMLLVASLVLGCARKREPLPVLGQLGAFALVDQSGSPITAQSLRGKIWVADFFFTHCPTICPRITRRMRSLQIAAADQPITFVSFSVDPENDTPPVLSAYAKQYGADLRNWSFVTGDLAVVKATIVEGFKLALDGKADPGAANGGIIHGSHLVLVDQNLAIRGYYRSDDDDEMKRLLDDARSL